MSLLDVFSLLCSYVRKRRCASASLIVIVGEQRTALLTRFSSQITGPRLKFKTNFNK